ncbi:hypothetical protein P171DRAFT_106571 [Karstenula rhodostoma CBS 690.94]|uniref:Uncharacterized protein n=1 Tax=Karstenula rhodostoma CBS 690.94 TaxID=1392251 RepID=A0A9P4PC70_9PLEO|nr:hypothetical protein P171DRAFT_106571 [Karstenula rhodostoma CBS 690.94]
MAKSEEALNFSAREMEVLALAWQCFESEPKIDIKKLARLTGYTEGSASVTIGKIKRKLKTHGGDAGATPAVTPKKTPKSGKRTAGTTAVEDTPSKKKKSKGGENDNVHPDEDFDFKVKPEPEHEDGYGGYGGYGAYKDFVGGY